MKQALALLLPAMFATSGLEAEQLEVNALKDWCIVVAPDAISSERYAAEEFQSLARDALGTELKIVETAPTDGNDDNDDNAVRIGPGALLAKDEARLDAAALGEEGCYIDIGSGSIAIAGGRPRGTLYAVYEFWERYGGVRFLTFDHTYIPADIAEASIPCERYIRKPVFSFRWSYYRENREHPAFAARLRCNTVTRDEKLGGITRQKLISHSYDKLIPVQEYGKEHPEYYSLYGGERHTTHRKDTQLCVTNPEVLKIVVDKVLEQVKKHPEQQNVVVSQNDNQIYCRCPTCEAINQREESPMGANLAFVNAVAERVVEVYPDVMIGTLAYQYTRKLPKTIRPHKNVQIQLCSIECCTHHAIDDPTCPRNRQFMADLKAWTGATDNVYMWNYNTNFSNLDLPFPNLRNIGRTVKCFADHNIRGVFMQANGVSLSGEMSDLRNYVIANCLWRPGLDSWKLTEEFCRLHYGKAAETIIEYLAFMNDNVDEKKLHPICFCSAPELGITPDVARKAVAMFDKALAEAENDVVRDRVEKASISAFKAVVSTHGDFHFDDDGLCRIKLPDGIGERYLELLDRYHVTMMTESFKAADFVDLMKRHMAGMPYVAIENDHWRVAAVPELNGRVLSLLHRPTGREMLFNRHRLFTRARGLEQRSRRSPVSGQHRVPEMTGHVEDNAIHLNGILDDGSKVDRLIRFDDEDPGLVRFKTTVHQAGKAARWHKFSVHPEFDTQTDSADPRDIGIYVHDEAWRQLPGPFDTDRGDANDIKSFAGGEYAFCNRDAGYGAVMRFAPESYEKLMVWWRPERYQLNLEMMTPRFDLQPGQSHSFEYAIAHLDDPPQVK